MINKNVYIFFPAGYHGSYLKWAIEVSDLDSRKKTISDPVNYQTTEKFGGVGTSHMLKRIPSHQSNRAHQQWMILNSPTSPNVYLIHTVLPDNTEKENPIYDAITDTLFADRDGIIIFLHSGKDPVIESYGKINCVTKWPSHIDSTFVITRDSMEYKQAVDKFLDSNFRAIDSASNREFRNFLVKYNLLRAQQPLNFVEVRKNISLMERWYAARNRSQPHEVNEDTYISEIKNINQKIFEINCKDIPSEKFLNIFTKIMTDADLSDCWNIDAVQKIHQQYIDAQPNLQWFDSFKHWENTGELDDYLTSHSVIESEVIQYIFKKSNFNVRYNHTNQTHWLKFYSDISEPHWPNPPPTEKNLDQLPDWIQDEILNKFNFKTIYSAPPVKEIAELDWENMSLVEINDVYQKTCKR
jgi:hypothetical protein